MIDLVHHLVRPIVANPGDVHVNAIEGDASILLELSVHPDDRARLEEDDGRTLRAIRTILSAASGQRKASLDLVAADDGAAGDEE